jgi:hypothetical protein
MKIKDDSLFVFLNYIFKSDTKDVNDYNPPTYLINRWVSMANPAFARIVNLTTNKWYTAINDFNLKAFYKTLLPKYNGRIKYIKKEVKEKEIEEDVNMASILECSQREINLFKDTLAELDNSAK